MLDNLLLSLQTFSPHATEDDGWTWNANPKGAYSASSAYSCLMGPVHLPDENIFSLLWNVPALSNALALAWKVLLDRVQTRSNLFKRHVIITEVEAFCPVCSCELESVSHLFFSCSFSWNIWMTIYRWLGLSLAIPKDDRGHFIQHTLHCW